MSAVKLAPVDVVVVGVGVAGSILCKEMASTGLKVVGLERGRMIDPQHDFAMPYAHDELKYDRHSDILQNLSRETVTFRNTVAQRALPMREMGSFKPGECVGGAGMHWGAHARRFLPWDFEMHSRTVERYGHAALPTDWTGQDWGIAYDELEPYYDQFEHLYGVGGKAGNLEGELQPGGNPFEGARSREFPNPPSERTHAGSLFAEAAQGLGLAPFQNPTAAMTSPYTNPYRLMLGQCVRGGFCNSHGCAMGAKASPLTTVIPALARHANFELRAHANVTRIELDSERKRAVGVHYVDANGREIFQPADLVILASYTFNNTRLLLLSGIGRPYDPATGEGVVGRNYAYQTGSKVALFFDDKVFNPFMGGGALSTSVDDFNGDNFDHAGLDFIGGAYLAAQSNGATPIRSITVPPGTPRWGGEWKRAAARYYNSTFSIHAHGGCQSYRTNYLDLDPTYRDALGQPLLRMTFDWHDNERRLSAHAVERAVEIARAIGPARHGVHGLSDIYSIVPYQSTHNVGGAVMGADPATSVVNKYLQSWDVPNVFVVGASAFPQNSANPPTLTVGALACWTADAIKDEYLRKPGALI
ncbi:Gluconate 2-dehydrogenase flavoprotein precursor [Variovorax sp. SRS16]|uniref:GMC family oxidoreductase n=1 Tax=Variovorax sp. SRS16 TaxID=282217 RepID=UPI0013197B97|nr:GMC family oxidoreductase [Variovorax sp. SRS16]VTU15820.1 Gluconate 2-dehydrogenase flavoprotein precursor [Variovorax sp. SRS16]